jgi:sugar/nucleoside kinase (ribokinase family)
LTIGSSSAIFACGAARLGLKVAFMGVVGDDLFGRFMLGALEARGVDVSQVIIDPAQHTGFSVILSRIVDRAILTYSGAMSALPARLITDGLLVQARHLHIASYFLQTSLQPGLPDLFSRAHALGLSTSLDPNWDPDGRWQGFDELLPHIDVFLPNETEAMALTHTPTVEDALQKLCRPGKCVAIKQGAQGASARLGDQVLSLPSLPVLVVDTVGAGDCFDAGFIYGFLHDWELAHSLRLAVACGALSTRRPGGVAAQPTLDEASAAWREW